MRMHFVTIPVFDSGAAQAELNRFLAGHRVLAVERQLVADGAGSAWAVCVSYVDRPAANGAAGPAPATAPATAPQGKTKRGKVDYREVLEPADFEIFVHLRALRKTLAEREGVPAYAVFTNEQLAALARTRPRTLAAVGRLPGVGPARVEKYATTFLAALGQDRAGARAAAVGGKSGRTRRGTTSATEPASGGEAAERGRSAAAVTSPAEPDEAAAWVTSPAEPQEAGATSSSERVRSEAAETNSAGSDDAS